jgi:hypothetical protein
MRRQVQAPLQLSLGVKATVEEGGEKVFSRNDEIILRSTGKAKQGHCQFPISDCRLVFEPLRFQL